MNKIFIAGLAALALTTVAHQEAHAWSKFNFGIGMNTGWEGGGNSVAWGALRGQNTPGAADAGFQGKPGFGGSPGYSGYSGYSGFQGFQGGPIPETYQAAPSTNVEPPLAPSNEAEKVAPPTPLRPAAFYPNQPWGYTPAYPTYPGYPTYPATPAASGYPTYPVYYTR